MQQLNRAAKAYVAVLVASASGLTLLALARWPPGDGRMAVTAAVLLACMTAAWLAPIPFGPQTKFYLDTAVSVAAALLLVPGLTMAAAGGGALLAHGLRREMRDGAQAAFNAAQTAFVAGVAALVLHAFGWRPAQPSFDRLALALPAVAALMFVLNVGLVAAVAALDAERPVGASLVQALRDEPGGEALAHLSLVAVGALAALLTWTHPWSIALLAFPLAATWLAVRRQSELRDAAERARLSSDAHLAEAQRLARLGNWTWDPATDRVAWSDQVDRLLGKPPGASAPSYAALLRAVDPADRERVHQALQEGWRQRAPIRLDLQLFRGDDGERHVHLRGELRPDEAGGERFVGTMQDVTERVAAERAMRQAKERAEAAERTKHRLLAMASHDLRTPLTAIRGALDLLARERAEAMSDDQRDLLQIAHGNVERLTALVNDLLDLARIEAGRLEIRLHPVDLRVIVDEVVEALAPQADAKGLPIDVAVGRDVPPVMGDPDRLYQIVLNLVNNAVKFTDAGRVVVSVAAAGDWVELAVADTGIGIQPEALPFLFDEFHQHGEAARRAGGSGLGLNIVRRLAALHGGSVRAQSEPGQGSTFTLRLPVRPVRDGSRPPSFDAAFAASPSPAGIGRSDDPQKPAAASPAS